MLYFPHFIASDDITFPSLSLYPPACIHTVGILGPMFGFMLGSFLAKIYVDVGFVDLGMGQKDV